MSNSSIQQNPLRVVLNRVGEPSLAHYGAARTPLDTPGKSFQFWNDVVALDPTFEPEKEHLVVTLLNIKLYPTAYHVVSVGSLNESVAHPREIFRAAVVAGAYGFVLSHNHPSGDPSPSEADRKVTRRIAEGAEILQVKLFDHVVVGMADGERQPYFSFRENGLL